MTSSILQTAARVLMPLLLLFAVFLLLRGHNQPGGGFVAGLVVAASFVLALSGAELKAALAGPRLERAIGVLYRPETERPSHYFSAQLSRQFDVVVHVDRTRALEPLEKWARHEVDLPETYPTGV